MNGKLNLVVRILLGLMLVILGLNKFLQFMPMPPMPDAAGEFMGALVKSGYLMVVVALVEIGTGLLLLVNKYQALALVLVFPVLLNAFLFHIFLNPSGIMFAALAIVMNVYLMLSNKAAYEGMLQP